MKILVVGDSYCPAAALRPAFGLLAEHHEVTFADVTDQPDWRPTSPSELRIKEFLGSPDQVAALVRDHEVLVVQGAPVTDAVLDQAPALRLIACARGGPVNVDLEAASARGNSRSHDARQERRGCGRADDGVPGDDRAPAA